MLRFDNTNLQAKFSIYCRLSTNNNRPRIHVCKEEKYNSLTNLVFDIIYTEQRNVVCFYESLSLSK